MVIGLIVRLLQGSQAILRPASVNGGVGGRLFEAGGDDFEAASHRHRPGEPAVGGFARIADAGGQCGRDVHEARYMRRCLGAGGSQRVVKQGVAQVGTGVVGGTTWHADFLQPRDDAIDRQCRVKCVGAGFDHGDAIRQRAASVVARLADAAREALDPGVLGALGNAEVQRKAWRIRFEE
jgi:hypothetical protein